MSADWRLSGAGRNKGTTRPDDAAVARIAATQNGVVSSRQLNACGIDRGATKRRVDRGHLHPFFHGVYAVGHECLTQTGSFTAAVLGCRDGAVLSGHSAAAYHDMFRWDGRDIDVIVAGAAGRKIDGIRPHRSMLDPRDVWTRDNIRMTTPARTILDVAATRSFKPLRRMVRQALAEQRVSVRQLVDVLRRHPRHRGAATLRAVIADGPVPTRSDLEDLAIDLLDSVAIPRPEANPALQLDGRTIRPDLLFCQQRLAIELDSRRWHHDPLTQQGDADKQAILEAHGHRVLRVSWRQIVNHPKQTITRIRAALSPAG